MCYLFNISWCCQLSSAGAVPMLLPSHNSSNFDASDRPFSVSFLWFRAGPALGLSICRHLRITMPLSRAPSPQSGLGGMPPPPGVHQDLDHPDTTLYKYNITCQVLCFTVVSTSVFVRLYAKTFIRRELKVEDCKLLSSPTPFLSNH